MVAVVTTHDQPTAFETDLGGDGESDRGPIDKELVVETAAQIADSEGLDAVTLTGVAKALNISQPALYRHVDGYDDLIRSLGLQGRRVLGEALAEAALGVAGDDAVRAMGHAWREVVKQHPGIYAATDRFPCAGDEELEEAVDRVIAVLGQALAAYDLEPEDEVHVARTLRSTFHGLSLIHI